MFESFKRRLRQPPTFRILDTELRNNNDLQTLVEE